MLWFGGLSAVMTEQLVAKNRGGRPVHPVNASIKEGLRIICDTRAAEVINGILTDPDATADNRLRAIELCLGYAIGKPRQTMEVGIRGISLVDDIALLGDGGDDDGNGAGGTE